MADPKISLDPDQSEDIDIDDPDNPELTEERFAKARPFKDVFPEFAKQWKAERDAGRGMEIAHVRTVEISLPQALFDAYAEIEPGWAVKMEEMLESAIRQALEDRRTKRRA